MKWYSNEVGLTFDDVLIRPNYSELTSRFDTDYEIEFNNKKLNPIIAANMSSIATVEMQLALAKYKVIVPFHRFQSIEDEVACLELADPWLRASTIGLHDKNRTEKVAPLSDWLFLELAHADTKDCLEEIKWIKQEFPNKILVVGNVATADACKRLFGVGCSIVKVGVGGGSICITRLVTGCGVPQLSAILECADVGPIIADGGIRYGGDIVKSIAAGSDFVMIGSLLAGTEETPGSGYTTRDYVGMSSKEAAIDRFGKLPKGIIPEGITEKVPYRGSADKIIQDLIASIRQGMAMVGAKTIAELRQFAVFQKVSNSTILENQPHIKFRI